MSETMRSAIDGALAALVPPPAPRAVIHNLQGNIPTDPAILTIFLYEITEDASTRNRPMARVDTTAGAELRKPPLTLLLRYLLTPFAGDPLTEQRMIGRALQVLYDHPIFAGPDLQGDPAPDGLVGSADALKTTLAPLSLEERARVWYSMQKPYRLSVSYEVRVANIEPETLLQSSYARSRELRTVEPEPA